MNLGTQAPTLGANVPTFINILTSVFQDLLVTWDPTTSQKCSKLVPSFFSPDSQSKWYLSVGPGIRLGGSQATGPVILNPTWGPNLQASNTYENKRRSSQLFQIHNELTKVKLTKMRLPGFLTHQMGPALHELSITTNRVLYSNNTKSHSLMSDRGYTETYTNFGRCLFFTLSIRYDYPSGTPCPDQGPYGEPAPTRTPCRMYVWFVDRKQFFHSILVTQLTTVVTYLVTIPFNYPYAPTYIIATQCLSYYYPPT